MYVVCRSMYVSKREKRGECYVVSIVVRYCTLLTAITIYHSLCTSCYLLLTTETFAYVCDVPKGKNLQELLSFFFLSSHVSYSYLCTYITSSLYVQHYVGIYYYHVLYICTHMDCLASCYSFFFLAMTYIILQYSLKLCPCIATNSSITCHSFPFIYTFIHHA
jgi:hypothetical protein